MVGQLTQLATPNFAPLLLKTQCGGTDSGHVKQLEPGTADSYLLSDVARARRPTTSSSPVSTETHHFLCLCNIYCGLLPLHIQTLIQQAKDSVSRYMFIMHVSLLRVQHSVTQYSAFVLYFWIFRKHVRRSCSIRQKLMGG
ncbi:hypothetical protein BS78_05G166600 [Paspalum vaginatum]|nr:hypothetical protein BS78_05G166600 [Paspalum vaginatum]KAJ1275834.1 hypothetical protein BS78_05G166600 [Paspalum vaginatum]KAJ1275835.1 hypothetical protein BS78_05G166600 [Paspalum vaginatum]KAJ1275836.1 hypothetical protein BS78_05G166600 [Paspalum vaginatum]